jgi:hypothetical protein
MGFTLLALGHTVNDRLHVMTTGDITASELDEPLPSSVHECNIVFILQCFPSSNKTTAEDELLENGRTQEPQLGQLCSMLRIKPQTSKVRSTENI